MFHFDTYRSCHYDCPLVVQGQIGFGFRTLRRAVQWVNVGCKSYQNIAGIRHDEVFMLAPALWSRHGSSYAHGSTSCLPLTTRAHPNSPVRLPPRPNSILRSYGGIGSEQSPLYGTPAPAGWVFGSYLPKLPLCSLRKITTLTNSTPLKERPRTAP